MKRVFVNGLEILSLLLCVVTVVLWMRSDASSFAFAFAPADGRYISVWNQKGSGTLEVASVSAWEHPPIGIATWRGGATMSLAPVSMGERWERLGIGFVEGEGYPLGIRGGQNIRFSASPRPLRFWNLSLPYWMLVTFFALLPASRTLAFAIRAARRGWARRADDADADIAGGDEIT